jgi:hypothetical protein
MYLGGFAGVGFGRNPCLVRPAQTRWRLRASPFLLEGRRGFPIPIPLRVPGETLGPVRWFRQQRRVYVASLLEGVALVLDDPVCL